MKNILGITAFCMLFAAPAFAQNVQIDSFNKAKRILEKEVYHDHRFTIYCNATFEADKKVKHPDGFTSTKYEKRSKKIEWEHVVPAQNFGRAFVEWREGHSECVDSKGKSFKGRNCASKINHEYRFMQSDMYNLHPAIGSVNALRSNYNFTMLPSASSSFGACEMKIEDHKAEPPVQSRGRIARTYQYMDAVYSKYKMSNQQVKLMKAWDKMYPVSEWECTRYQRIKTIQGNENPILSKVCH